MDHDRRSLNTRIRNFDRRNAYVLTKYLPQLYFSGANSGRPEVNVGDKFILNEGNRDTDYVMIESANSSFPNNTQVYLLESRVFFDNFSPISNSRKAFGAKKRKTQKRNKGSRKSRKSRK